VQNTKIIDFTDISEKSIVLRIKKIRMKFFLARMSSPQPAQTPFSPTRFIVYDKGRKPIDYPLSLWSSPVWQKAIKNMF
jgi:hypothetical protein